MGAWRALSRCLFTYLVRRQRKQRARCSRPCQSACEGYREAIFTLYFGCISLGLAVAAAVLLGIFFVKSNAEVDDDDWPPWEHADGGSSAGGGGSKGGDVRGSGGRGSDSLISGT